MRGDSELHAIQLVSLFWCSVQLTSNVASPEGLGVLVSHSVEPSAGNNPVAAEGIHGACSA